MAVGFRPTVLRNTTPRLARGISRRGGAAPMTMSTTVEECTAASAIAQAPVVTHPSFDIINDDMVRKKKYR